MADRVYSHAGLKFSISTTTQDSDITDTSAAGLTYTQVGMVGSVGEYGISTNILTYDMMDTVVAQKAKGITNAGDTPVECARNDTDAGQIAMVTAGAADNYDAYVFKVEKQDGAIDYLRGLVTGPVSPGGRNEDFDLHMYTLALVQAPVHVDAP